MWKYTTGWLFVMYSWSHQNSDVINWCVCDDIKISDVIPNFHVECRDIATATMRKHSRVLGYNKTRLHNTLCAANIDMAVGIVALRNNDWRCCCFSKAAACGKSKPSPGQLLCALADLTITPITIGPTTAMPFKSRTKTCFCWRFCPNILQQKPNENNAEFCVSIKPKWIPDVLWFEMD